MEREPPKLNTPDYGLENLVAREFVGRRSELHALAEKLNSSDQVAITAVAGMGGIGKTALAQQYVRQAKAEYPGGRWYFKVQQQNLATLLVGAATIFDWQLPDNLPDDRARVKWCYDQWCHHFPGARLLLLDDVQAYGDVKHFLPQDDASFRVLMTSRQRFEKPVDRLDLGVLPLEGAMALMLRLMDDDDRVRQQPSEAEALCEWVGRLPLGVELMARYLAVHGNLSFGKLLERLERKKLDAKAMRDLPEEMAYEYSIEAAFELSWQDLAAAEKTLMGLLAVFAAAPIPQALIEGALPDWDEEDLEALLDGVLVKRNLLQGDGGGSYQLHQLIREFTVHKLETELSDEASTLQKGVADSLVNFAQLTQQIVTVSAQQALSEAVPHMELVAQELSHVIEDSQACLKMTEDRFGFDHPDTATSLNNLASLYRSMGRYSEAEPLYGRSLEIREAQLGSDHPDTATSLNNLAGLYESMGRYSEAEPLYGRSLEIREAQLGSDHPDTATSLNNLASLYRSMGRYSEAEPLYGRSLEIREAQLGSDHLSTAASLNNLAGLYESMGRYSEAEPLYGRSLEIKEAQLGSDHPDTATSLNNLALLYRSMGRYSEAEPLYGRSLEISEAQLGSDHPSTATSLNNLAGLYESMGRYSEAEPLYGRSLEISEAQLGSDHPSTATSLNNLAGLYESMGRYSEAEPLYGRSLEIREAQLGSDHPDTAASYNNMALFFYGLERYAESANFGVKALEIFLAKLGQEHPNTQTVSNNFVAILQKVIETNQTQQLSDHPLTQAMLKDLLSEGSE